MLEVKVAHLIIWFSSKPSRLSDNFSKVVDFPNILVPAVTFLFVPLYFSTYISFLVECLIKQIIGISLNGLSLPQYCLSVWKFIWKNSNEMKKNNKVFRNSLYHLFLCNYMSANIYLYKVTLEKSVKYVQSW